MRKIVQLAPSYDEDEDLVMYALCDDGTVWVLDGSDDGPVWHLLEAKLPQDSEPEKQ